MRTCLAVALLISVAHAAPAVADVGCATNLDCSLNGVCSSDRTCACDVPWTGASCGRLQRLPAQRGGAYGFAPNVSSWGGSILPGDTGDAHKFHMYVAEMQGTGLLGWKSHSACVHAVSDDLTAPFMRQDVVLGAECHGPVALRDPKDGQWLLFHQGSGPSGNATFMRHSTSPNGPWLQAKPSEQADGGNCGMPTAAFHPNGTLFMVCDNGAHLVSAPGRNGPYADGVQLPRGEGWEDPTLWFDRRGNFHVVFHVFSLAPFAKGDWALASGHLFSEDGLVWHNNNVAPFNGTVDFVDGSSRTFATRERPQLLFADAARTTPSALTSGVSSQPIGPICDTCWDGACSQCKITRGRDWTYTIIQPLATEL